MQDLVQLAADRVQLFLSPSGQSHAILPSGAATPIFSEDFFTWLVALCGSQQIDVPFGVPLANLLRKLDADAHGSNRILPAPLRTSQPDPQTLLIDLQDNFDAVELTRKGWRLTANFDAPFLRPTQNIPLPPPEPPDEDLTMYLTKLFEIQAGPAQLLSNWLAHAFMPDAQPPILVITGEARDEAASKLRMLLDPVPQPLFPFPATTSQLGQLALTNRVLAFAAYNKLTETRKAGLNRLRKGMPVRLKETNQRRPQIFTSISRPIIIAAESAEQISSNQLTVEINRANQGDHPKLLGALLNLVAEAFEKQNQSPIETNWQSALPQSQEIAPQSDPPGP